MVFCQQYLMTRYRSLDKLFIYQPDTVAVWKAPQHYGLEGEPHYETRKASSEKRGLALVCADRRTDVLTAWLSPRPRLPNGSTQIILLPHLPFIGDRRADPGSESCMWGAGGGDAWFDGALEGGSRMKLHRGDGAIPKIDCCLVRRRAPITGAMDLQSRPFGTVLGVSGNTATAVGLIGNRLCFIGLLS